MRPLRGGQGTFDRIIENVRQVAGKMPHRDRRQLRRRLGRQLSGAARLPEGAGLRATSSSKVAFKPVIRDRRPPQVPRLAKVIPLTAVSDGEAAERHLHDVGRVGGVDDQRLRHLPLRSTSRCRSCAKRRRSAGSRPSTACTWGPCEIHKRHAHTIGPDGSLYACPGFTGDATQSTGHIDGRTDARRAAGGGAVRSARGVEGVRRLRVHPGVRRRLLGRRAHRARRHEQAELPQAGDGSRPDRPGPPHRRGAGGGGQ